MGTRCTVVRRKSGYVLVEWQQGGTPYRAWVMPSMIEEDSGPTVTVDRPEEGIPYGVDWSKLVSLNATPQAVNAELKRLGIWTYADLRARPNEARNALQAVYGFDMAALIAAAVHAEKTEEL